MNPEVAPEVNPEVAPEVNPEVAPEVNPEVAPEVNPEVAPEVNPEVNPEVAPEVNPEVAPEVALEVSPQVNLEVGGMGGMPLMVMQEDFLVSVLFCIFTAHTWSMREGNIFSLSVHRGGPCTMDLGTGQGDLPPDLQLDRGTPPPRPGTWKGDPPLDLAPDLAPDRGTPPPELAPDRGTPLLPPEQCGSYGVGGTSLVVTLEVFLVACILHCYRPAQRGSYVTVVSRSW